MDMKKYSTSLVGCRLAGWPVEPDTTVLTEELLLEAIERMYRTSRIYEHVKIEVSADGETVEIKPWT